MAVCHHAFMPLSADALSRENPS